MLSIEYINSENRKRAREAREAGLQPLVFFDKADIEARMRSLPYIGDLRPKGWRLVEQQMVDSSGLGAEDEPALTKAGFIRWAEQHLTPSKASGYAIISAGQFQVVVGRFVQRGAK